MPFVDALNAANISPELRAAIDALAQRTKAAEDLDEGAAVPIIHQFIDAELARLPTATASATSTPFSTTSERKCNLQRPDVAFVGYTVQPDPF